MQTKKPGVKKGIFFSPDKPYQVMKGLDGAQGSPPQNIWFDNLIPCFDNLIIFK